VPRIIITPKAFTAINRATKVVEHLSGWATYYMVQPTPDTYAVAVVSMAGDMAVTVDVEPDADNIAGYREPFQLPAEVFHGSGARVLAIGIETVSVETAATMVTHPLRGDHENHAAIVDVIASTIAAVTVGAGEADMFTVPAAILEGVVTAAGVDEARPVLTSLHVDGGEVTATDSYRLAYAPVDSGTAEGEIHAAAVKFALTVKASTYLVRFARDGERAVIAGGGVAVLYRRRAIGGSYPAWRNLIPDTATMTELVNTPNGVQASKAFTATVKAVGGVKMAKDTPAVFTRDGVSMTAKGTDYAITGAVAPGAWFTKAGDGAKVAFNPVFFATALANYTGPVSVLVNDSNRPAVITGEGSTVVSLLMPVRV
jgi:hypothetical protein